jgi:hypothetical protein
MVSIRKSSFGWCPADTLLGETKADADFFVGLRARVITGACSFSSIGFVQICGRPVQSTNACIPMAVTLAGIVILVRPAQPSNARSPIWVTLLGIVTMARLLHPSKARSPRLVTLAGIMMVVSLVQPLKAPSPVMVKFTRFAWNSRKLAVNDLDRRVFSAADVADEFDSRRGHGTASS